MTEGIESVSDSDFEEKVIRSPIPVVLDFYADWCGPCRQAEAILKNLSHDLGGRVLFARVDIDKAESTTESFGVHAIPTFIFLDKGQERGRQVGLLAEADLKSVMKKYFALP